MKFTAVLMTGVAVLLPLSLFVSLLMLWQLPNRAIAEELKSTCAVKDAASMSGANTSGFQGQPRTTDTAPTFESGPTEVIAAPLGTEEGIEELRQRIQEGGENMPIPKSTHQQEDSSE